jgi:hypothetical protein
MRVADCHPNRKHKARGLCGSCYDRVLKEENPRYRANQTSNFYRWKERNPERYRASQKARTERDKRSAEAKQKKREQMLRRNYGITQAEYDQMLGEQRGGCALCFRAPGAKPLHVDHSHETGTVRGLLCHRCNWFLGTVDADPTIIQRIIDYRKEEGGCLAD